MAGGVIAHFNQKGWYWYQFWGSDISNIQIYSSPAVHIDQPVERVETGPYATPAQLGKKPLRTYLEESYKHILPYDPIDLWKK